MIEVSDVRIRPLKADGSSDNDWVDAKGIKSVSLEVAAPIRFRCLCGLTLNVPKPDNYKCVCGWGYTKVYVAAQGRALTIER